ncbi:Hypothetical predicted protein [Marmota monax]|uniref:Uncharacterized protein n=1 Tax=Marmota monax TaxID=9995 RepID=A0A5E4A1L4_MARMO|nr:hypothetical protein GHT09_002123 [Marmota monax]VTJ50716.1 Hypothetical predicted protein [Marmota monax]
MRLRPALLFLGIPGLGLVPSPMRSLLCHLARSMSPSPELTFAGLPGATSRPPAAASPARRRRGQCSRPSSGARFCAGAAPLTSRAPSRASFLNLTRRIASLPPPPGRRRWAGGKPPEGAAVVRRKMATSGGEEAAAAAPAPGAPATGADTTPGWEVAVRPLLSASYSAFEMKELPQLVASVIERYRAAAPAGRRRGEGRGAERLDPLPGPPPALGDSRPSRGLGRPGPGGQGLPPLPSAA